MVPIKGEWTPFADKEEKLKYLRLWGLIPPKSKVERPVMVVDGYFGVPEPCEVVGYKDNNWAVIQMDDGYHAIFGEYLAELQPQAYQKLPYGMCFAEVLQDYIVLDIETTGFDKHCDEIIEFAAVRYSQGGKTAEFHTMIRPRQLLPPDITMLTGITAADVADAPFIEDISTGILEFLGCLPLIGHNAASFDIPFLSAQLEHELSNAVIDTLPLARNAFPMLSCYKLEYLKTSLALSNGSSHRAMDDVYTTNALLWACLSPRKYEDKMWQAYMDGKIASSKEAVSRPTRKPRKSTSGPKFKNIDIKSFHARTAPKDQTGPLAGKNIVFTGNLSCPREYAMQQAVDAGAILKLAVSGKTDYLVVGQQDQTLVGDTGLSAKEAKAIALNESGKRTIKIINEAEFFKLVTPEGVQK